MGIVHPFADRSDLYMYPLGNCYHTDLYPYLSGGPDVEKGTGRVSGVFG